MHCFNWFSGALDTESGFQIGIGHWVVVTNHQMPLWKKIHFPKIHWLGRTSGRRSACQPSAVGAAMWTIDSPSAAGGGWRAVMALVCPNQCICHKKYDLLWTMSENKESILLSFLRENPLLWKPTKWNARNLSYWTGGWDTVQNQFIVEKPTMNTVLWIHGITALGW